MLGGFGAAVLSTYPLAAPSPLPLLAAAFLFEAARRAVRRQRHDAGARLHHAAGAALAAARVRPGSTRSRRGLPPAAVLAELPLGQPDYDLRAMYYSIVHWRPILNGYSGFFPLQYGRAIVALNEVPAPSGRCRWRCCAELGATHVIVHEGAYLDAEGRDTSAVAAGRLVPSSIP